MTAHPVPLSDRGVAPSATRPAAFVSIDIDPIDTHLAGYGFAAPPCARVYERAVPRFLAMAEHIGVRATLFVVARDAASQAALWRAAVRSGHEIASHSLTHPLPFATLPAETLAYELRESRRRLEDATGTAVVGFRAPGWDVSEATLAAIADAGYRYDASLLPTPALLAGSVLRWALSGGRVWPSGLGHALRAACAPRHPHRYGALQEFPLAVSPLLRVPFTHTLWYVAPYALAERTYRRLGRGSAPLGYMLHAADFLDLERDGLDPRMARHPGMALPLEQKLWLLEERLRAIATDYDVRPYRERLGDDGSEGACAMEAACGHAEVRT